jgi:hypothetical protein
MRGIKTGSIMSAKERNIYFKRRIEMKSIFMIGRFLRAWASPLKGCLQRILAKNAVCDNCGKECGLVYRKDEIMGFSYSYSECCHFSYRYREPVCPIPTDIT